MGTANPGQDGHCQALVPDTVGHMPSLLGGHWGRGAGNLLQGAGGADHVGGQPHPGACSYPMGLHLQNRHSKGEIT